MAPFRLSARAWASCSGTKMDVNLFTMPVPGTIDVHKHLGKGKNCREISGKFGVVTSTAYEKVNKTGDDENLFRLVLSQPRTAGMVPKLVFGHQQTAMFRLAPVPSTVPKAPSLNEAYVLIKQIAHNYRKQCHCLVDQCTIREFESLSININSA